MYSRIRLGSQVISTLQLAKSRSAPIQWKGIPRLELAAAHLLAHLVNHFISKVKFKVSAIHLWTDAKIVLCWLSKPPSTWEPFVANRCSAIFDLVPHSHWHYIKIQSCGCYPKDLKSSRLWWNGPFILMENLEAWLKTLNYAVDQEELSAASYAQASCSATCETALRASQIPYTWGPVNNFSRWSKVIRVTAYCLRFIVRIIFKLKL